MGLSDEERRFVVELRRAFDASEERAVLLRDTYADLRSRGQIGRYVVHRYMCHRGDQLAIIFRFGGLELCAVRDYKLSPGLNTALSVPAAREHNTLDGDRHWPGHVYDLEQLARSGRSAVMTIACRHVVTTLGAVEVLDAVVGTRTGKPGRPTVLHGKGPQPT